ncbi:hypothetical protein [Hydrogenobacter thermophilus]|uniref:Uncharacterized protein n=1 Tax=Hydrogenobacter thermophilus (strain DSM 6534 / IAM 12695 / TK-6) TaxID=608538 RepID=D3DGR9_HYDTT|nr:hypothetical protein [Hydrogenobacter thermophilus]BAI69021.1 hypothetical protein HTH_0559 [Hydrogenobacter thermophilus TK-6]
MWQVILAMVPWEKLILYVFAQLTGLSGELINKLVPRAVDLVIEIEKQLGDKPGKEKAEYFNSKLREILGGMSEFVINLLRELAVAYAKKKKLI